MATRSLRARTVSIAAALAATLFPAVVHACPVCAGRSDAGPWRGIFLGMFIFFPFAVVAAVVRYVRSQEDDGASDRASASYAPNPGEDGA